MRASVPCLREETPLPPPFPVDLEVAYLLKRYPRLSETFILHEMLALEASGVRLHVYAMLDPNEHTVHPETRQLRAQVTYLPSTNLSGVRALAQAHASLFWRFPGRYLRTLRRALTRVDCWAGLRHFLRAGWLGLELERKGIKHLHAHFAHGPAVTAHFVSLLTGLPNSFTAHAKDIYTTRPARIAERMREARFVVTCTHHNHQYLASLVDSETAQHLWCIRHGVDLRRFHPGPPARSHPPLILAVGRLVEKKGFTYLVEACALLERQGVSFQCWIVGSGPLRDALREQISALGLENTVELHGFRTQEELVESYRQATVCALPCIVLENGDRDGIPNVLVEAMAMGLPVVSTSISGIPELVEHERTGLLVPPRDPSALAAALARLLVDPHLRQQLGSAASRSVTERFDLARNVERLHALFAQVLTPEDGCSAAECAASERGRA